jgi:hypothetical protein
MNCIAVYSSMFESAGFARTNFTFKFEGVAYFDGFSIAKLIGCEGIN